jgi:hypothetical protein
MQYSSFLPSLSEQKTIIRPSGLQLGLSLLPEFEVSLFRFFPVGVMMKMSIRPPPVMLQKAILSPFGDQQGEEL